MPSPVSPPKKPATSPIHPFFRSQLREVALYFTNISFIETENAQIFRIYGEYKS